MRSVMPRTWPVLNFLRSSTKFMKDVFWGLFVIFLSGIVLV
jgi:hypothetical protein